MSTAILISGQLRTFASCYASQKWHVFRHFDDPHFFITVQELRNEAHILDPLIADYGRDHVHIDLRVDPVLELSAQILSAYDEAPYANAAPAAQLLMQHWYQNEVWKFFQSRTDSRQAQKPQSSESDLGASAPLRESQFDTIIRLRPDQFFHSFDLPEVFNSSLATRHSSLGGSVALTPWWGRFGGINDRLAILGREAARAYFTVYDQIPALLADGCPFHPESLVKAALLEAGCTIHETLRTEFTTLRANGQHRPPEIMPWDMAHAALRSA